MKKYILRAGLLSLVPSLLFTAVLSGVGIINDDTGPDMQGPNPVLIFLGVVIFSPIVETFLLALGLKLLSFVTNRTYRLAGGSALLWAVLHSLLAPAWGLGVVWPFFVFSCAYLAWRAMGFWRAILVVSCIHAFQNFLPAILIVSLPL